MPLTQCPHCRAQIQVPDVGTESVGACQYCRKQIWLYKCFSCMKVTAFLPTLPRPTSCPRCNTLVRSGRPLVLPKRKRIVIEILESPGTGNVANARNIWKALRQRYEVHILVSGSHGAMAAVFTEAYVGADPDGDYDLLIVPGLEIRLGGNVKTGLRKVPPLMMNLPPPFCAHIFRPPFLRKKGAESNLQLDPSLPFLPLTRNWRQVQKTRDFQGMKARYFPNVDKSNVFFIVTYLSLGGKKTKVFEKYEEHIIILNFGKYKLETMEDNKFVVSVQCERLPMAEFEECLLECTTLYPAVTDGGNTVGTLQALELPYYDLSMRRVMDGKVAFLNDGACNLGLFETLGSRQKDMKAFQIVQERTRAYYEAYRQVRQQGRGMAILLLVGKELK